jgi:hypothetical protein
MPVAGDWRVEGNSSLLSGENQSHRSRAKFRPRWARGAHTTSIAAGADGRAQGEYVADRADHYRYVGYQAALLGPVSDPND